MNSQLLGLSFENITCDEHKNSRLCFVNVRDSKAKKLLCPRCLLKYRIPYDAITMIDDHISEIDPTSQVAENTLLDEEDVDAIERSVKEEWTKQARQIEDELDVLVDEFSAMIDGIKNELQQKLQARSEALRRRKIEFVTCRDEFIKGGKSLQLSLRMSRTPQVSTLTYRG
jgi:hypothetical protein